MRKYDFHPTTSGELGVMHGLLVDLGENTLARSVRQSQFNHLVLEGLSDPNTYINAFKSKKGWAAITVLAAVAVGVGFFDVDSALASGHDGFHGGHHVGPDDQGGDAGHTSIGSTQIQHPDGMVAWIRSHVSLPPIDSENDFNLKTGSNFTLPLMGPEDMASMEYFNSGESGLFLTTTKTTNENGEVITVFGLGNKVSPSDRSRMGVDNVLFDLSLESATQSPHIDQNGNQDGVDLVRNFTTTDIETLKFLLANHSDRKGMATDRMIEALFESSSNVPTIIRILEGKTVDGDVEKQLQLVVLRNIGGQMIEDILFQKELRPGEVKMSTVDMSKVKNAVIIQSRNSNGENILVITPAFPEGTDNKIIPWQDETGKWWGGTKEGDAQLELSDQGIWENTKEIVKNTSEIGFELGAKIEGQPEGVREVTDIIPAEAMDSKEKALFEIRTNPEKIGFAEGETRVVYVPTEDGNFRIELQRTSNPADVIAEFGTNKFIWDWEKLVSENGENVLFGGAIKSDRKDINAAFYALGNTTIQGMQETGIFMGGTTRYDSRVIYSKDGKSVIIVDFLQRGDNPNEGYVFTRGKDGKPIVLWVQNFDKTLPNVTK